MASQKAFINKGGKANYLKVKMPDTNEALGAKAKLIILLAKHIVN